MYDTDPSPWSLGTFLFGKLRTQKLQAIVDPPISMEREAFAPPMGRTSRQSPSLCEFDRTVDTTVEHFIGQHNAG